MRRVFLDCLRDVFARHHMRRAFVTHGWLGRTVLALFLLTGTPAQASPIVADISTYRVAIDAGFTGIRLFIFGARNASGDVVVVIRGPEKTFVVRKKENMGGIWVNRKQFRFSGVPEFYAVASAKPLENLEAEALLKKLGIGSNALLASPEGANALALFPEFSNAFFEYQQKKRLYQNDVSLSFMGETLFKTTIPFPDTIPKGDYTAEIYLISNGELSGMQTMPIRVEKTGFDAFVADIAQQQPLLYGLLAVLFAACSGMLAAKAFGRL